MDLDSHTEEECEAMEESILMSPLQISFEPSDIDDFTDNTTSTVTETEQNSGKSLPDFTEREGDNVFGKSQLDYRKRTDSD